MAIKIDESEWSSRVAATVGQQVKRYRERPIWKMSAQNLADRTKELGYEVKRSVIANLENGRRGTVSVADILVLAAALEVSPTLLIFPIGTEAAVEVLPGVSVDPWTAHKWWNGDGTTHMTPVSAPPGTEESARQEQARRLADEPIRIYENYFRMQNQVTFYENGMELATEAAAEGQPLPEEELSITRSNLAKRREQLAAQLERMTAKGYIPPKEIKFPW